MDTSEIVWIVVAVLVVLALAALLVAMMRKRRTEKAAKDRAHAENLRRQAATHAGGIEQSQTEAEKAAKKAEHAEARAERARIEAERAKAHADEARQGLDVEQAKYEDRLREADRLDPEVDHRADDYRPGETSPGGPTAEPGDGSSRVR